MGRADQRAGRRAADDVGNDAVFHERLQNADVRAAARAAAAEHQPDTRSLRFFGNILSR